MLLLFLAAYLLLGVLAVTVEHYKQKFDISGAALAVFLWPLLLKDVLKNYFTLTKGNNDGHV